MGDKVRHTTERGGNRIRKHQLPRASVGYEDLSPALRRDVTLSRMAARAAKATKQVGDILEYLKDLTLIGGVVTAATENTITDNAHNWEHEGVIENFQVRVLTGNGAGQIRTVVKVEGTTLTVDPPWSIVPAVGDTFEVASSSRITSRELGSIVTTLNQAPDAPIQFSAIKQTADEISSVVALLNSDPDAADQFSAITQLASEIDLRVAVDEVISAINLSEEGVKIQANKIEFMTPTIVPGLVHTTSTQSDWQQGTLSGVVATAAGDLELAAEFSDDFDRSTLGPDWEIAPGTQGSVQLQNGELVLTGGSSRRMWVRTTRTFEARLIVFRARRDSADAGSDVGLAFNWDGNPQTSGAGEPLNGYRLFWNVWDSPPALSLRRYDNGVATALASIEFPPDNNEHEFAILIEDGTIRVFVDGVQMLQANDSTYTSGYIGLTAREDSTDANRRGRYNWIVVNREPLGSRVSPILDLSPVGTAAGSAITWNATAPTGTSVAVETNLSLDGGQTWQGWQEVTNGGPIPGITSETDLSNAKLQTRVTLSTTDPTVTPTVHSLTVEILKESNAYNADNFPIEALDNQIWMDSTGLNMQNVASPNKMMNLNAHRLAFWDANGEVVAGMGNIDDLIQQLDPGAVVPGMGVLIAQGSFLATQGVLRRAIADFSISREKITDGAIDRSKISNAAVGYAQLFAEELSVPDTQAFMPHARNDSDMKAEPIANTWRTHLETTIGVDDPIEVIRVTYRVRGPRTQTGYTSTSYRTVVNGNVVHTGSTTTSWTWETHTAIIDLRQVSAPYNIQIQYRVNASSGSLYKGDEDSAVDYSIIEKNQRYSIVPAKAQYYISTTPSGCTTGCEINCQYACQKRCETGCQLSCQSTGEGGCSTVCENNCQSTCEKMSQSCFVDGTPVTVYDPETGEISEIPIEDLKPGMFMPYYDPQTDRVMVSECISNEPSITATLYEIKVEGPTVTEPITLRVTPEQPFDVWRKNRLTDEWGWSVIQAQYLKPGDKMIRPFDEQNRMPNVVSVVKLPPQPPTRVWDPKTVSRRYIVAGFADALVK